MQEFITPPNHKGFSAKKLFDENGKIKWGAIAYIEKGGGGPEGITPKRFSQMSQTRFLHKLFEHLILRIPTTSSPKNAEAHIGISQ